MKQYLLLSFIMLFTSLVGCRDAKHLEELPYIEGSNFEMNVTGAKAEEAANLIKNMRIFLFTKDAGSEQGVLKHEILNLDKKEGGEGVASYITSEHVPAGEWTMVAISNLSPSSVTADLNFEAKYSQSRDQLLYQFTPGVLTSVGVDKGANCPEIVVLTKDIIIKADGSNPVVNAAFKRAVAKVKVTIVSTTGNIKQNGESNMVEIVDVASHLSLYGGLLTTDGSGVIGAPDRQNHAVLDSMTHPLRRAIAIDPTVTITPPTGSIDGFPSAEFIVPAYDDNAPVKVDIPASGTGHKHNKFLRINVDLQTEHPTGRYKNSVVVSQASLSANMIMHIKLNVKAELEATVVIEEWNHIAVESDIVGTKITGISRVAMDHARFGKKYESGDVNYESDGSIKMKIADKEIVLPTSPSGTVDLLKTSVLSANVKSWLTAATWTHDQTAVEAVGAVPAISAKGHFNFTYKLSDAVDKEDLIIDLTTGNVIKRVRVVYDNGFISPEVLTAKVSTFIPEGGSSANRNYWGLAGIHLAKRGWSGHNAGVAEANAIKGIDPFTDATGATAISAGATGQKVGDGKAVWQNPAAVTGFTSKEFDSGEKITTQMNADATATYGAAKYCLNTGVQFYLPGVSELKWIQQHGNAYLGESYKFSSSDYWSSTENDISSGYSVNNGAASGVSGKTTSLPVRCVYEPFELKPSKSVEGFSTVAGYRNNTVLTGFDVHTLLDVTADTHTITSVTSSFNKNWDAVITNSSKAPTSKPISANWSKVNNGMTVNGAKIYFYPFRTSPGEADIYGRLYVMGTLASGGSFAYELPLTITTNCRLPDKDDNYSIQVNGFRLSDRTVGSKLPQDDLIDSKYELSQNFSNDLNHPDNKGYGSAISNGRYNWGPQKTSIAAIAGEYFAFASGHAQCAAFKLGRSSWRMPTRTELGQLVTQTRQSRYRAFILSTVVSADHPSGDAYCGVFIPFVGYSSSPAYNEAYFWSSNANGSMSYDITIGPDRVHLSETEATAGTSLRCVEL